MNYKVVACGGTFDYLHKGHKSFLEFAINIGDNLVIGLTTDAYLSQFKKDIFVEPYENRQKAIEEFFESLGKNNFQIVPLSDPYGPTVNSRFDFDAIVVTHDTKSGAEEINKKRIEKNLNPLRIIICPIVTSENDLVISSTNIRRGVIDKNGKSYVKKSWLEKDHVLPKFLRSEFQKPFGELILDFEKWIISENIDQTRVITVGDETTLNFLRYNIKPQLSIIDFRVKRKSVFHNLSELGFDGSERIIKIDNPAGVITSSLFKVIHKWFEHQEKLIIQINGEDDLAVLPSILSAPLGFEIFYGQPDEGLVRVVVTEEKKEQAYHLMKQFES